jgi:5'-nucleotidase
MILVTNDDGIYAPGLWTLAGALQKIDQVIVVAPDREQSAVGTAITLRHTLRVQRLKPMLPDIETYAVEGTPGDCVIIGLGKLAPTGVSMVVSGINAGPNVGDDVFISGTVSAALQGYLHNLPSVSISMGRFEPERFDVAARFAAIIARFIKQGALPDDLFLNLNIPDMPATQMKGVHVTQLAHKMHIDTVEESATGWRDYYRLVRRKLSKDVAKNTDIWAVEHDCISLTSLHSAFFHQPAPEISEAFCNELLAELKAEPE